MPPVAIVLEPRSSRPASRVRISAAPLSWVDCAMPAMPGSAAVLVVPGPAPAVSPAPSGAPGPEPAALPAGRGAGGAPAGGGGGPAGVDPAERRDPLVVGPALARNGERPPAAAPRFF